MSSPATNASSSNQQKKAQVGSTNTVVAPATKSAQPAVSQPAPENRLPSAKTLAEACKIAITLDKAIMMDYYKESFLDKVFLGKDTKSNDRVLIKSKDEYTSLIKKMYKTNEEFIVLTENSIYIVSNAIQSRNVNMAELQDDSR
jgi:hypothetical protein